MIRIRNEGIQIRNTGLRAEVSVNFFQLDALIIVIIGQVTEVENGHLVVVVD